MKIFKILIASIITLFINGCSEKSPIQGLLPQEITVVELNQAYNIPVQVGVVNDSELNFTMNNEIIKMTLYCGRSSTGSTPIFAAIGQLQGFSFAGFSNLNLVQGFNYNESIATVTSYYDANTYDSFLFTYYNGTVYFENQNNINFSKTNYFVFKKLNAATNEYTYGWISFLLAPTKITFLKVGYLNNSNILVGVE